MASATVEAMATTRHPATIAGSAVAVFVVDQLTKWWALNALADESIGVVWTLQLRLAHNSGAAFSFGAGTGWGRWIPVVALGVVAYIVWQGRLIESRPGAVAIGMVIGGALGNLSDRLLRAGGDGFFQGRVVDFIDFQWWPVFNVADMGVVIGGFLLVIAGLRAPDE